MGKKKPKQEVNEYYMSMHLGVCVAVDAFTSIVVGEKEAWTGYETTNTDIVISKRELFGGPKKEGGVAGVVRILPGEQDQLLPDHLATRLGRASGADCPGFRGVSSLFFTGTRNVASTVPSIIALMMAKFGGSSSQLGFYWTANSPYLRGIWVGVRRAPKGLNPVYALVPQSAAEEYVYETLETIDLHAQDNAATSASGGLTAGITVDGFSPDDIVRVTMPSGGTYVAWSPWGDPSPANSGSSGTRNGFNVIPDGVTGDMFLVGDAVVYDGYEAARAAFGTHTFTGASSYVFYIQDSPIGDNTGGLSILVERGSRGLDANPVHMIYECLTNIEWGMGAPSTIIDVDNFEAAAETVYDERLGLSMLWTRQDTIENFVTEIIDHIQATLFVNPRTGLLTIKLIRDDYDVETLREITPDNADLTNFQRKAWGEITNEVIVTWTNPINEQEETVTLQDPGSIAMQGDIVSDSRNYYGVRSADLAMKLAARDLRAASAPMASIDVELDRTAWDLLPGEVVKITWPEYGLAGAVFRVGPVDYGKPGEPLIKATLVEDVFSLTTAAYSTPPASGWVNPDVAPEPMTYSRIITVPAFLMANYLTAAAEDSAEYPEVLAGILASTDSGFAYELYGPTIQPDGSTVQEVQSTNTVLGRAVLTDPIAAESSTAAALFSDFIGQVSPGVSVFVFIGDDDDGDEEMEIALITATDAGAYTLARGLLDTVPRAWAADTPVWFLDLDSTISDLDAKSDGETVTYKLLTRTSLGVLDPAEAPELSDTLTGRPHYPNRPANVTAHGEAWSSATTPIDAVDRVDPWVTVTWANRNRLLEDSQVMLWTDATMTPETGQTTTIEVRDAAGTLLDTHDDLSGTSFDVPDASFGTEGIVRMRFLSKRSDAAGDFTSLQYFEHWVKVATSFRVTEEGDVRMTEQGDVRTTEN